MCDLHIRIDDRLIHGQIVTAWVKTLGTERIIAIDETMANNPLMKSIMTMGVPSNIKASIVTTEEARTLLKDNTKKTLVVVRFARNLLPLIEELSNAKHVNIGNCSKQEKEAFNYRGGVGVGQLISLTSDDVDTLNAFANRNISVIMQQIPTDKRVSWEDIKE